MDIQLPLAAKAVVKRLSEAGGRPFLVGGLVRDAMMGRPVGSIKDVDIEVHGLSMEQVQSALASFNPDMVGVQFGVLKVSVAGADLDISIPRRESKIGVGHTGFAAEFDPNITIEEASARRDFTMNAIMVDAVTGEVFDPHGGILDIRSKRIQHTSEAFSEDPLRSLRAVQFSARFGFNIAAQTGDECRRILSEFEHVSSERAWTEWEKIAARCNDFSFAFRALLTTGLISVFPLKSTSCIAFAHCIQRHEGRERDVPLIMATLALHAQDPEKFLEAVNAPNSVRKNVKVLQRPCANLERATSKEQQARVLSRHFEAIGLRRAFMAHLVDVGVFLEARRLGIEEAPSTPFVTGDDLIALGLTPGPGFKDLLSNLALLQDLGEIGPSVKDVISELTKMGLLGKVAT